MTNLELRKFLGQFADDIEVEIYGESPCIVYGGKHIEVLYNLEEKVIEIWGKDYE